MITIKLTENEFERIILALRFEINAIAESPTPSELNHIVRSNERLIKKLTAGQQADTRTHVQRDSFEAAQKAANSRR